MKPRFVVIAVVFALSMFALFFFTGSGKKGLVLADASLVAATPDKFAEDELRVRGFVKAGSVIRYGRKADFTITLDGKDLPVHFDGSTQLPDTFTDGAPVRADGILVNGKLVSHKVEAKCASKYEADYAKRSTSATTHPVGY